MRQTFSNRFLASAAIFAILGGLFFWSYTGSSASAEVIPTTAVPRNTTTVVTTPPPTCPTGPLQGQPAPAGNIGDCPKEGPYIPSQSAESIKSISVTAWGTKVVNNSQTLSLQARGTEPGDTPQTVQVNFDLCALKDITINDTDSLGSDQITLDTLQAAEDGLLDGKDATGASEDYSPSKVLIIDNTPMVNRILTENSKPGDLVYGDAGDLVSVLRKDTCTTASVEVKRSDRNDMVFGFVGWTIPQGEFRVAGGVTQLGEQGPSTIRYLYEIN